MERSSSGSRIQRRDTRRLNAPFSRKHKPMKGRYSPPATPAIGQNAKSLDELLQAIKDEYVYNTRVHPSPLLLFPMQRSLNVRISSEQRGKRLCAPPSANSMPVDINHPPHAPQSQKQGILSVSQLKYASCS